MGRRWRSARAVRLRLRLRPGKTGWEALDKWVGGGGGGAARLRLRLRRARPVGRPSTSGCPATATSAAKAGDSTQEQAAELKEDLEKIREDLPMVEEPRPHGKGFFAALKRFFRGK